MHHCSFHYLVAKHGTNPSLSNVGFNSELVIFKNPTRSGQSHNWFGKAGGLIVLHSCQVSEGKTKDLKDVLKMYEGSNMRGVGQEPVFTCRIC